MTKLLAVPVGVKGAAIAASAVAHVAIAFASFAGGHRAAPSVASSPNADAIEIEAPVEVVAPSPTPDPVETTKPAPTSLAAKPHTHDYAVPPSHDAHPHDPRLVHVPLALGAPAHDHDDHDHDDGAPAPVVAAPAPLRFTIIVGTGGTGGTVSSGTGAAAGAGGASSGAPEIVAASAVSVPARAIATVRPTYPPSARAAEIEADVMLEIVVDASGAVVSARVARAAGYGLDDAALEAIRRFRFSPAQKDGRAVAVRMPWLMQFRFQ